MGRMKKICIQNNYKYEMQWPAFNEQKEDKNAELSISLFNFQVIQIDIHSITMSMNMEIEWSEYRLHMNTPIYQIIYLSLEDQKQTWSPQIDIGNNMVSEKKKRKKLGSIRI